MRAWGKDDTFKLIAALEQNPCLWQKAKPMFKNLNKRNDAYNSIARLFDGCTEKDVKGSVVKYFKSIYTIVCKFESIFLCF